MKKKLSNEMGVTLIEILIGIVISVLMMAAIFTSYTAVNNTYSQVIDTAKISQSGRDIIGMLIRDVRIAGFKYFNDTSKTPTNYNPILITKNSSGCDKLELTYGDRNYDPKANPKYTYVTYKITYECKASKIIDKKTGNKISAYALYKSKSKWDGTQWQGPSSSTDDLLFSNELVVDHIQDLIFNPLNEKGQLINPVPNDLAGSNKIKVIDIAIIMRSQGEFFKKNKPKKVYSLGNKSDVNFNDKFLRESILVSAHTRNMGLE
tara:strand:+ start:31 stop:819 length:789 start_codon:yes stop_codon:yes gene_type:complete